MAHSINRKYIYIYREREREREWERERERESFAASSKWRDPTRISKVLCLINLDVFIKHYLMPTGKILFYLRNKKEKEGDKQNGTRAMYWN